MKSYLSILLLASPALGGFLTPLFGKKVEYVPDLKEVRQTLKACQEGIFDACGQFQARLLGRDEIKDNGWCATFPSDGDMKVFHQHCQMADPYVLNCQIHSHGMNSWEAMPPSRIVYESEMEAFLGNLPGIYKEKIKNYEHLLHPSTGPSACQIMAQLINEDGEWYIPSNIFSHQTLMRNGKVDYRCAFYKLGDLQSIPDEGAFSAIFGSRYCPLDF